jgi:hypothetical protein
VTVQDMIDEFNDHGFTDTSVIRKVAMINDTLADLCSREPWPFLEKEATINFDGTNPGPTNQPADLHAVLTVLDPVTGNALDPERYDVMQRRTGNTILQSGTPSIYYFLGSKLRVWQVPSNGYALTVDYIANHPVLTSSSVETDFLVPPRHHRAVVLGSLYKLYDMDDDFDIGASFQAQYEDRILKLRNDVWSRQFDRPEYIHGIDDFDLQFLG